MVPEVNGSHQQRQEVGLWRCVDKGREGWKPYGALLSVLEHLLPIKTFSLQLMEQGIEAGRGRGQEGLRCVRALRAEPASRRPHVCPNAMPHTQPPNGNWSPKAVGEDGPGTKSPKLFRVTSVSLGWPKSPCFCRINYQPLGSYALRDFTLKALCPGSRLESHVLRTRLPVNGRDAGTFHFSFQAISGLIAWAPE